MIQYYNPLIIIEHSVGMCVFVRVYVKKALFRARGRRRLPRYDPYEILTRLLYRIICVYVCYVCESTNGERFPQHIYNFTFLACHLSLSLSLSLSSSLSLNNMADGDYLKRLRVR